MNSHSILLAAIIQEQRMSNEKSLDALINWIDANEASVIALSGEWGAGKTHLWERCQKKSKNIKVKNALYASLFGVRTINNLKIKILSSWLDQKNGGKLNQTVSDSLSTAAKFLKGLHRSVEAIDEIPLIAIPSLIKDKLIVIDDIERKHKSLEVDELLGFVNECISKYSVQFLLILNDEKLSDKAVWDKFREKIIDREIAIKPTADEACQIALKIKASSYSKEIITINHEFNIANIRSLVKIISSINEIFKDQGPLEIAAQEQLLPPAFLLSAAYHGAINNGPPLDYISSFNSTEARARTQNEDNKFEEKWIELITKNKIYRADSFENEIATSLKTHIFNRSIIKEAVDKNQRRARKNMAMESSDAFLENFEWDPQNSQKKLLQDAKELTKQAAFLDLSTALNLCDVFSKIDNNITEEFINDWIKTHTPPDFNVYSAINAYASRKIPKKIFAYLEESSPRQISTQPTLKDAILNHPEFKDDKERQDILGKAEIEDYVNVIKNLSKEDFKRIIKRQKILQRFERDHSPEYRETEKFNEAYLLISREIPRTRIAELIDLHLIPIDDN